MIDLYKRSSYQNDYKITFYLNNGKVFGGYWKEVHRVENVYVNLALHSIREMAALTKLRNFNIEISTFH